MPYTRPRPAEPSFEPGQPVAVRTGAGSRRGTVVGLADDAPQLLVRWEGSRVCDWVKFDEVVHIGEAGEPRSS